MSTVYLNTSKLKIRFGKNTSLKPNKGLQDIIVNGLCIGYVITEVSGLLSPMYESFWSNGLSEQQMKDNEILLKCYDQCDTEDEGYYQVGYVVNNDDCDSKEWDIRLKKFCNIIYNILIKDKKYVQSHYNRQQHR